ncbi:hypothetical protein ACSBR1_003384 [Camellia fascicularis]
MGFEDPHPFNFSDLKDKNLRVDSKTLLFGAIFLLLLIISTYSFVYFLYACVRRGQLTNTGTTTTNPRPSPPPRGLDKAAINCLPIVSYGSSCSSLMMSSDSSSSFCRVGECSICLGGFQDGEKVKVLPMCHHGFHSKCVDKWLRTRSSCPLCRASVVRVDQSFAHSDIP